jgi:hypothetical protein
MVGRVHGHVVIDLAVTIREMSLGGLGMESSVEFSVGAVNEFRLTLGDGSFVILRGRVLRCRNVAEPGQPPRYLSGVQFVDDEPTAGTTSIEGIIEKSS